jgi:hypothetical protein
VLLGNDAAAGVVLALSPDCASASAAATRPLLRLLGKEPVTVFPLHFLPDCFQRSVAWVSGCGMCCTPLHIVNRP